MKPITTSAFVLPGRCHERLTLQQGDVDVVDENPRHWHPFANTLAP